MFKVLAGRDALRAGGRQLLNIDARRFRARRLFTMGLFRAQEDKLLSLDRRIVSGGAVGNPVVRSEQMTLAHRSITGGKYVSDSTNRSTEALGGVKWDWFPADLDMRAETLTSLQRPRVRLEVDSQLKDYVFRRFFSGYRVRKLR